MLGNPENLRRVTALALGQCIALLIAGTGVCSTYLADLGVDIPTSQSFFNYVLLIVFLVYRLFKKGTKPLLVSWRAYALLAIADVEANFVIVKAYQYTSITSVMLLDCCTIPIVMLLSYRFLDARYNKQHYGGVALCLAGVLCLVVSDVFFPSGGNGGSSTAGSGALYGDILCIIATCLYAVSNVGQEIVVKTYDRVEFLGMLGLFGTFISGVQVLATEREQLLAVNWTPQVTGYMTGFVLCLFAMYTATSHFLRLCDATLFNLSLLTSDVWAILAAYLLFGSQLSVLYFVSLALIVGGLVIYNRAPPQSKFTTALTTNLTAASGILSDVNPPSDAMGIDNGAGITGYQRSSSAPFESSPQRDRAAAIDTDRPPSSGTTDAVSEWGTTSNSSRIAQDTGFR